MITGTFGHSAEYAHLFNLSKIGGVVTKIITQFVPQQPTSAIDTVIDRARRSKAEEIYPLLGLNFS